MSGACSSRRDFVVALGSIGVLGATSGCGFVLYPERRGMALSRQVDVMVAVVDGALLLLGLVPGIVAYAVDFSTGCIYWPEPGRPELRGRRVRGRSRQAYERALLEATGVPIRLNDPRQRYRSVTEVDALVLRNLVDGSDDAVPADRLTLLEDADGAVVGFELA